MSMQEISDAAKASSYLAEQLRQGTTLAKLVLERTDFSRGRYLAAIPEGCDQARINFHWSMAGLQDEERGFAMVVKAFVRSTGGGALVADTENRESQGSLEGYPYRDRMVTYLDEVYWRIDSMSLPEETIIDLLGAPVLPYPLCVFLYLPIPGGTKSQLSSGDLTEIVDGLVTVAVAAFDTDSYLLWWRDDLIPFSSVAP